MAPPLAAPPRSARRPGYGVLLELGGALAEALVHGEEVGAGVVAVVPVTASRTRGDL